MTDIPPTRAWLQANVVPILETVTHPRLNTLIADVLALGSEYPSLMTPDERRDLQLARAKVALQWISRNSAETADVASFALADIKNIGKST